MTTKALKQVSEKLKLLPESMIEDVENYIDFLSYKHSQESFDIPQWHKEEVFKRIKLNKKPIDAFDMIDNLEE
ncbi:hypothetical protein [Flavobacterium sp. UBA6135]|jgi:hypothetical protein|uniref:hypothetical protein n=1 Tax=Flavobacterium sp. UBA6135 TaxID=1946553 RepID=UPI0025C58C16|nr:hypothetical protein [Flavobacterium sp. UBA6135]